MPTNDLKISYVPVNDLKPAEYNPRKATEKQWNDLDSSIDEFGLVDPLVVNNAKGRENVIIGGHFRLRVAKEQGIKTVPVVYVNISDSKKERELNLRLNKNLGDWDYSMLANFQEFELKQAGFDSFEIDNVLKAEGLIEKRKDEWDSEYALPDGIPELIGYYGGSFWKDIEKTEADTWQHLLQLPLNEAQGGRQSTRYSRTNPVEIERIVKTYMREGDYFLESCCGWSTFGSIAKFYGYSGEGVDIWDTALDYSKKQTEAMPGDGEVKIKNMDALKLTYKDNTFDFVYCNPPFFNLEGYKQTKEDLSVNKDYSEWIGKMEKLSSECFRVQKPDTLAVFTMADFRKDGKLVPATADWIVAAQKVGYEFWDMVTAEVRSQNIARRKDAISKRRTVKSHEYVLVFRKP